MTLTGVCIPGSLGSGRREHLEREKECDDALNPCRVNIAHKNSQCQSTGLASLVKVLKPFPVDPSRPEEDPEHIEHLESEQQGDDALNPAENEHAIPQHLRFGGYG